MKVMIYDNSRTDVEALKILIDEFFMGKEIPYTLYLCANVSDIWKNIQSIDILFLDIELPDANGIQIGLRIKEMNPSCRIIITSQYNKYLIEGYKIHAERYLLKPIHKAEFMLDMEAVVNEYFRQYSNFMDEKISFAPIYLNHILYIEALDKHSILHMSNGKQLKTPYRLKYWNEKFEKQGFIQSHKSFLVNLNHVKEINKVDIILWNDDVIPLSRNYKKLFETAYTKLLYNIL